MPNVNSSRRWVTPGVFLAVLALSLPGGSVWGQAFPNKTVRIVVPFPPGNASDVAARALSDKLSQRLGQPVIIENKAGAAGALGADFVAKAAPDGYTLMITSLSPMVISPHINKKLPYDALKDFVPVARIGYTSMIMVVPTNFPVNTVPELLAYAKNNPGKLNYASVGAGTLSMLTMEVFKKSTNTDIMHVPYKGSGQAMTDLIGGTIPLMVDGMTSSYSHVKAGKLKALAVFASKRTELAPEIPTLRETGIPSLFDVTVDGWTGTFAPQGTPVAVVNFLNQEINKVLEDPEFKKRANGQSLDVYTPSTPAQFTDYVRAEYNRWSAVIKPLQIEVN
jgi:tripartite-type tricarboxylate transporter receptor subunit TctC